MNLVTMIEVLVTNVEVAAKMEVERPATTRLDAKVGKAQDLKEDASFAEVLI